MKTVGIMSMQKVRNYGSFLQAYGLKKTIESLGFKVVFVDYNYEKEIVSDVKEKLLKRIIRNINVIDYVKKKRVIKKYNVAFDNKYIPFLYAGDTRKYTQGNIDYLIIGSDEVFNCLQPYPIGYSPELFGKNFESIPVCSYAASFGQTNYERLCEYGIEKEIAEYLKRFKKISVRDENSYDTINKLIEKKPVLNLDPVLITNYNNEIVDNVKIENYIIVYAYPGRLSKKEQRAIKQFAKRNNKHILSFGMYQNISDYEIVVNPFEIFAYFKKADFVITDTFHGSIFSIKSGTNFCTIVRKSNSGNANKLVDLLKRLKLENRIIADITELDDLYSSSIDYTKTYEIMDKEKSKSIDYLKECLDCGDNDE